MFSSFSYIFLPFMPNTFIQLSCKNHKSSLSYHENSIKSRNPIGWNIYCFKRLLFTYVHYRRITENTSPQTQRSSYPARRRYSSPQLPRAVPNEPSFPESFRRGLWCLRWPGKNRSGSRTHPWLPRLLSVCKEPLYPRFICHKPSLAVGSRVTINRS